MGTSLDDRGGDRHRRGRRASAKPMQSALAGEGAKVVLTDIDECEPRGGERSGPPTKAPRSWH